MREMNDATRQAAPLAVEPQTDAEIDAMVARAVAAWRAMRRDASRCVAPHARAGEG